MFYESNAPRCWAGQRVYVPLTDHMPKCMVPVAGKPALEHTIEWLKRFGIRELVINLHYLPEVVQGYFKDGSRWGVHITYSFELQIMGTAGALKLAASRTATHFEEPFILWYGDNLSTCNIDQLIAQHQTKSTLATIALFQRQDVTHSGIVGLDTSNRITRFLEKPREEQVFSSLGECRHLRVWIRQSSRLFRPIVQQRFRARCIPYPISKPSASVWLLHGQGRKTVGGLIPHWTYSGYNRKYPHRSHNSLASLYRIRRRDDSFHVRRFVYPSVAGARTCHPITPNTDGFVLSAAINKYIYVYVNRPAADEYIRVKYSRYEQVTCPDQVQHDLVRPALKLLDMNGSLEIVSMADVPAGTGLGSSGTYLVALLSALYELKREKVPTQALAESACHIEMNLAGHPVGKHDHYLAAFGGITCMDIGTDGRVKVSPLDISMTTVEEFRNSILLFYTGVTRSSGDIFAIPETGYAKWQVHGC